MPIFPTPEVNERMKKLNSRHIDALNQFDKRALEEGEKHPVFIYNVSPIWEHRKFQGQLGTIHIKKCAAGQKVSEPVKIPGVVVRFYDHGLGRKDKFLETGMEIAQDICSCNPEYPAENANNNLTNFGVFLTDEPLESFDPEDAAEMVRQALAKHDAKVREIVLEADQRWASNDPMMRKSIVEIHHDCLEYLGEERPWSFARGKKVSSSECPFCGSAIKPNVVKCPTCSEVVDKERYQAMKKGV